MANFTAGTSFSDGVTNDVTAAKLNALVADAVPTSNLALTSTNGTISNFTSSTATITGTITGSTNVINIGSGQIYKDASGNVGVGTASPSNILHVSKANGVSIFESTGVSSVGIRLRTNSTDRWQIGCPNASADLAIYTGAAAAERVRIDSSGNVGIGETSPSFTQGGGLHIKNSDRANLKLQDSTTNVLTEISTADNGSSSNFIVDIDPNNVGSGGCPLILRTSGGTERLRIISSGQVGIGTATPARLLTVDNATNPEIGIYTSGIERVKFSTGGSAASQLAIDIGGTERFRIDSSGNCSIGTATALSRLHVHGDLTLSNATTAVTASTSTITPPATVAGYLTVSINGTSRKIPYYAT
jgi:hypothetical protein